MLKYNKNVQKFIENNHIDISYFETSNEAIMLNKYDVNPIVAEWGMYENEREFNVSVADVIGVSIGETKSILLELNELFDEEKGTYQNRSVSMLEYDKNNIIKGLQKSFSKEPIILSEIAREKYVVSNNGMHRCNLLRVHYLSEKLHSKDSKQVEKLERKYQIPVRLEKIDKIKTYSSYLLQLSNQVSNIEQELDDNYQRTGSVILTDKEDKQHKLNDRQLIEYLKLQTASISKEKLKTTIPERYEKDEYFADFIEQYLKDTEIAQYI